MRYPEVPTSKTPALRKLSTFDWKPARRLDRGDGT
jgi:hypothetical protein